MCIIFLADNTNESTEYFWAYKGIRIFVWMLSSVAAVVICIRCALSSAAGACYSWILSNAAIFCYVWQVVLRAR